MQFHGTQFQHTHFRQTLGSPCCFARLGMLSLLICATVLHAAGQTAVTTWHYNNARTGANTTEKILTPSNVNVNTFGKVFTQPVDGIIVGQPLYLPLADHSQQGIAQRLP